ncbi:MAG: AIR synthase family protein [Nitrososphaerales archaeon]
MHGNKKISRRMKPTHQIGKVNRAFLEKVILSKLGAFRPEILSRPKHGVDVGTIKICEDKIMVFSTDPLSIIPALGFKDSGWLSAHLLANDIATSGLPPAYASLDFNLPPTIKDEEFKIYWEALIKEFEKLGVSVVSGHTGRYPGCGYSVIGAGTVIGVGEEDHYIDASMARIGDSVIITKGIAIEATAVLAKSFPNTLKEKFGKTFLAKAQRTFRQCSAVEDALIASSVGVRDNGVTAIHDATEGGVYGGLAELASASSKGLRIEKKFIPLSKEAEKICSFFGLDPYSTLSSGTMIITVRPEKETDVVDALKSKGITSAIIGKVIPREKGLHYIEEGAKKPIILPQEDLYWKAFWDASQKGWT